MARVLCTGATGFLGAHTCRALKARGHEVVALVRSTDKATQSLQAAGGVDALVDRLVELELTDEAAIERTATGCEAVFHMAGKVSRDPLDAAELHRAHVEITRSVLKACKRAGVKRAVVASTSGVVCVSETPKPIDERGAVALPIISSWPYYRTKYFAELAAFEQGSEGFEVVCVNPTLLLGPGDTRASSTKDVQDFLAGRVPVVPGGGLSFVDARDAAEGMVLAFERGKPQQRYLLSAQNLTVRDFIDKLSRISGVAAPVFAAPRSKLLAQVASAVTTQLSRHIAAVHPMDRITAEMAQYFWYVDASKATQELGWKPRDPMETLADTVHDLYDRGVVWRPGRHAGSSL